MEYEIRRIQVWSVVKIVFIIFFIVGAFVGIFYAMMTAVVSNLFMEMAGDELEYGQRVAGFFSPFFMILFFALFSATVNAVLSAFIVLFYNVFAQLTGGFRVDLNVQGEPDGPDQA